MDEDPSPRPEPEVAADPAPPKAPRRRLAILIGIAVVVVGGAIFALTRGHRHGGPIAAGKHDGGAAIHAPAGPQVPIDDATGVHLTGFVVDGAGLPVVGAEVTAEPEKGAIERALATGSGSGTGSAAPKVTVSPPTGADGRFVLLHLDPGRYRLRVTGAGLLAAEVRYVPVPSDEARIVVARQVAIDGTVTDGGKPAGGATVGIRGDAIGGSIEIKADAKGAFHVPNLPEGRYQVYAWQDATAARAVRVNLLGAGPFAPMELRLEAAAIVVGRVIDREEGTGVVAAIELRPSGDDQAPRYARSTGDGVFRIEGVPNGRWIADAFAPGYLSAGGLELEAGRGVPELALARGATIEGRVLDGDGHPVAGAAVRAVTGGANPTEISAQVDQDRLRRYSGRTSAPAAPDHPAADPQLIARGELGVLVGPIPPIPPPGAEVARPAAVVDPNAVGNSASLAGEPPPLEVDPDRASIWVTGSDGHYRIRGLPKAKLTVLAQAEGFAEARSRQVAVSGAEVVPGVDIVVTAGTFLVGRVTDQHGGPVVGAELAAQPEVGAPVEGFSDADGNYRLGPIAGQLELRATAYGHATLHRTLELAPSRGREAAERREDLVLEVADATLAGAVDDTTGAPVAGARLEVTDGSSEGRRALVGTDGTFSIDMLPPGHLRVRIEHPSYPTEEIDAVASSTGERVRLVLALGGAVEGVLLDNATGLPLASTPITATGPAGATAEATSDNAGRWKLGPLKAGHWKLEVKQAGYRAQTRELDVGAARTPGGTSVRDVRIDLARGAVLGGTVRDARGTRIAAAHLTIRSGDGATLEGDTDAQGEFRLRDCPTGDVTITATRGDQAGQTQVRVRGGDEILGLAVDLR